MAVKVVGADTSVLGQIATDGTLSPEPARDCPRGRRVEDPHRRGRLPCHAGHMVRHVLRLVSLLLGGDARRVRNGRGAWDADDHDTGASHLVGPR